MTLFISVLFIRTTAFLAAADVTIDDSTYELWRIENLDDDDILYEFELRAHMSDEIWKKNNTIYIIVADYEQSYWHKLLSNSNIQWDILGKNLKGKFDDKFLSKYINPTTEIEISTLPFDLKTSTVISNKHSEESEEILSGKYPYTTQKIHHLWSTEEITEPRGPSELWRVENVKSQAILNEFNDRAHLTDEIWKRGNTIDFIVGKHETAYWRRLLHDNGIKVKVLEHRITGQINDDFIKKYINTRRGGDKRLPKEVAAAKDFNETHSSRNESVFHEESTQMENGSSDEYPDTFNFAKIYGASELWRADNVISEKVLSELNDRAHLTDEIWKVNNTIYFILGKHETSHWNTLFKTHNINFKVLEKSIRGKFDDKFINKYIKTRRGQK